MTRDRSDAYRRVIQTLAELGPSKLLAGEQDLIRHAADTLLFNHDLLGDPAARDALEDVERLCLALVESGRWQRTSAMRLADDVAQCGPTLLTELKAA
jgi:hypothetical protein